MHTLNRAFIATILLVAVSAAGYVAYERSMGGTTVADTPRTVQDILLAYDRNDFSATLRGIDAQLAANPADVQALLAKAQTLTQEGSLTFKEHELGAQAIVVAQSALALDSTNSEAWRIIGYAHEIMQEYPEAHAAYAQALIFDSNNVAAISGDAHAYDLEGKVQQAADGYAQALALDTSLMHARMGYARMLQALGNSAGSREQFMLVATHTNNAREKAEAEFSAGVLSRDAGDHGAAEQLFVQATQDDASYALGFVGLAGEEFSRAMVTTSAMPDDARRALLKSSFEHLNTALTLNSNQSLAAFQLGIQLAAIGHTDAARANFTKLLEVVPQDITLAANDKKRVLEQVRVYLEALGKSNATSRVEPASQVAALWCFTDACISGGGNETYGQPALDAALASYDFAHATSMEFFRHVNQVAINLGIGTASNDSLFSGGYGFPLALSCGNGSPIFEYYPRGIFGALPAPNVTPITPAPSGAGGGGGSPTPTCTPAYACSGTSVTYRSASCAITTVTTCAAPAYCQSGASQCAYPSMSFGTFTGTYDATDAAGHTTHTTLTLDGHLRAYPALVKKGDSARLYWSVQNAASCTITAPNGFSSTLLSSGTTGIATPAISQQTVFTLHCTGLPRTIPATINETTTVSIIPVFEEQ